MGVELIRPPSQLYQQSYVQSSLGSRHTTSSLLTERQVRPETAATIHARRVRPASSSSPRACLPSERAFSESGWISTMRPSAPAAIAATASGTTKSALPAAWLGSAITGRCVKRFTAAIAPMSSMNRASRSTPVRTPRSHRTTSWLPPRRMYSAACNHSSTVAASPRFNRTGLWILPSFVSNTKFCILREPTCRMSAYWATRSI